MKKEFLNCPFCNIDTDQVVITENKVVYSVYDKYPVNQGHALIIPKRHCSNYFELRTEEQSACWNMVNDVKQIIQDIMAEAEKTIETLGKFNS